jgi:GH24 family phage-related lysozyme (muramidase)
MTTEAIRIARDVLCKPFEGYAVKLPNGGCRAYPDPGTGAEPWTIGWGSTGAGITKDTVWTREQAEEAMSHHLLYFCSGVLKLSPGLVNQPSRRLAAIISFAYNCGLGNYRISTLRKRVNAEDWAGAQEEIVKWNKAAGRVLAGLTRRRKAEAALLG